MKHLLLMLLFASPLKLLAAKTNYYYTDEKRNTSLEVGIAAGYNFISSVEDIDIKGFSNTLNVGIASTHLSRWLFDTNLQLISGPNNKQRMKVDFSGTGFSVRSAYSVSGPFRPSAAFGPSLTASYQFLSGKNPTDYANEVNGQTITSWSIKTRSFILTPALYYRSFKAARNVTNDPNYLTTRVEGWMVSLGVSIPAYLEYSLSQTSTENGSSSGAGKLSGYSIELSTSVFLGM